jgi:hypothetical protein
MSGTAEQLYFFVLFRATEHGQIRLQKMAGDMRDSIDNYFYLCSIGHSLSSAFCICFVVSSPVHDWFCWCSACSGGRQVRVVEPRKRPQRAVLARPVVEQHLEGDEGPLRPIPRRHTQGFLFGFWCFGDVWFSLRGMQVK